MNAAELRGVSYIYSPNTPFAKTAIRDVDFSFEENIITGIIGHTGSGKSTISQLLNGLLKPTIGEVLVYDKNIWEDPKKIRDICFAVGLVFQYPEYQLFEETVYKDVAYGPRNMGLSEEDIAERVSEALRFVGLSEEFAGKSPFDLSGGQKRRVAIAGVMAMRPRILILDEPAAGLDPRGRDEVFSKIVDYQKSTGSTVIMISHSMEDMAAFCDKILVMSEGSPFLYGTPSEIFGDAEVLERVGLTVPQVTKFALALSRMGLPVRTDIYTVEQAATELLKLLGGDAK